MDEIGAPQPRRRGRPPGSKNKKRTNRAPGKSSHNYRHKREINLDGAVPTRMHPHDLARLEAPDDSPIWAIPLLSSGAHMTAEVREKKMRLFLKAFAESGIYSEACQAAGIGGGSVQRWRKSYPQFEAAYTEAKEVAAAMLEREALNRAVKGWEEPVYQGGEMVGTILKKSDRILELMLRARVNGYNPKLEMKAEDASPKVDGLSTDNVESLLRILAAAEERGMLDRPQLLEGEFRDLTVDAKANTDD